MSTNFAPLEIPPGVVALATKKQRSTNWSEVNLLRWIEGQMSPVGGQEAFYYSFASRCRRIHGWYDLSGVYHIGFLCDAHLYIDTGGTLLDASPTPPIVAPSLPSTGGYGDGPYGADVYGTPRSISTIAAIDKVPDAFSLDNFGAVLYAMTSPDGRLLKWDPAVGGAAVDAPGPISGHAPRGRCFVVTQQRFLQIFGMVNDGTTGGGSARRFGWCDQENPSAWDFTNVTSQAGFLDIEPASPIITAIATKFGTLFWTGKKAYVSQFVALPYVYNYVELAEDCTPWSPQSAVTTTAMTLWMSQQGMFTYDGTSILPVACKVRPWVDDNIDTLNVRFQSCAVHVANYNELWWFFPENGQPYNTRCIIYNYKEGWWSMGRMPRSAGVTAAYNVHTIMADGLKAYKHEAEGVTTYSPGTALPFAETFDLNIASGGRLTTVKQLIPDVEGDGVTNLLYSLFYRNSRSTGTAEAQSTPVPLRGDGYVDFRVTGRDVRLRIDVKGPAVLDFTLGQHLIDVAPRGDR